MGNQICPKCKVEPVEKKCTKCHDEFCDYCIIKYHAHEGIFLYCKKCSGKLPICRTCNEKFAGKKCHRCTKE